MTDTLHTAPAGTSPRQRLPRWAWVLIGLLTVIALVASAIAVFASRDRQVIVLPPAPAPQAASPAPSPRVSAPPAVTVADGCLGGATELDRAVLTAQRDAPLTEAGAAAFAATALRWAIATPAPPFQAVTAKQVLAQDATSAARALSGTVESKGWTGTMDVEDGKYYVEAFDGRSAVVSVVGRLTGTRDGAALEAAFLFPSVRVVAQNGTWRLQDRTGERTLADLQRIGQRYAGGC